jgi:hypothetical protein
LALLSLMTRLYNRISGGAGQRAASQTLDLNSQGVHPVPREEAVSKKYLHRLLAVRRIGRC